jgi:multidrug efflux pump subunit AcrB
MRIWLDPDKVAARDLNASEVLAALRAQNLQVSAGLLNQPPVPGDAAYQINIETLGRLSTPEQFADVIVKSDDKGRVTRVRDIGRVELGAGSYGSSAYKERTDSASLAMFAEPSANSLTVEREVLHRCWSSRRASLPGSTTRSSTTRPTSWASRSGR